MIVILVESGVISGVGSPDFYVQNSDFVKLLKNSALRKALVQKVGRPVSVENLGVLIDGIWEESELQGEFIQDDTKGGQSFYDRF